jgi:ADP-ribosylglycohydrolase
LDRNQTTEDKVLGGTIGACIGDALGVPVEFKSGGELLAKSPVIDMRGYGTYNLPPCTWSDDTSMTLCLLDSLADGLDCEDTMEKFMSWACSGKN